MELPLAFGCCQHPTATTPAACFPPHGVQLHQPALSHRNKFCCVSPDIPLLLCASSPRQSPQLPLLTHLACMWCELISAEEVPVIPAVLPAQPPTGLHPQPSHPWISSGVSTIQLPALLSNVDEISQWMQKLLEEDN